MGGWDVIFLQISKRHRILDLIDDFYSPEQKTLFSRYKGIFYVS